MLGLKLNHVSKRGHSRRLVVAIFSTDPHVECDHILDPWMTDPATWPIFIYRGILFVNLTDIEYHLYTDKLKPLSEPMLEYC